MRHLRWLIVAAFVFILAFIARSYYMGAPGGTPRDSGLVPMANNVNMQAQKWSATLANQGRETVRIRAQNMRQNKDSGKLDLEDVDLEISKKTGGKFDKIHTAKAQFDTNTQTLHADGDVEIILAVPEGEQPNGHLLHIKTSGVTFVRDGKATTDKPIEFVFDRGSGKGVGAEFDPDSRDLILQTQVEINWIGVNPKAPPMHVEAGHAIYKEKEAVVFLEPWSKMSRDTLSMEAGPATLKLLKGRIDTVETTNAKGVKAQPLEKLEYEARQLKMNLTPKGQVASMLAENDAVLVSSSPTARTQINSDKIDMAFDPSDKDTSLTKAIATGHTVVESKPVARPNVPLGDTKILKSDTVDLTMRPGGEEIDNVTTRSAGTFEIIPNRPTQSHRWITGDRFWIQYGDGNQIQSFRTVNASTRSENPPKPVKPGQKKAPDNPPALTWSKTLKADFDPKTSQMSTLQQEENFKYEAGDRKALSQKATLDQAKDLITLNGGARVWDATGSTNADTIVMNQKSGDFLADGNVNSTRMPNNKANSSALANNNEPTQGKANKMTSSDKGARIVYEGNAISWQGPNRITADKIDLDSESGILRATGNVNSQFVDKNEQESKPGEPAKSSQNKGDKKAATKNADKPIARTASIYTVVKAPEMVYTEDNRLAFYKGGVTLTRPGLTVKGQELRAFLNDSEQDSSLDRAIVDGQADITQLNDKRKRVGTSEHAEYYTNEGKIILEGGKPLFVDSLKGRSEGRQMIYFLNDERFIVDGTLAEKRPESLLNKKKNK